MRRGRCGGQAGESEFGTDTGLVCGLVHFGAGASAGAGAGIGMRVGADLIVGRGSSAPPTPEPKDPLQGLAAAPAAVETETPKEGM